jgi:DHA2 family multidrug resistance protein
VTASAPSEQRRRLTALAVLPGVALVMLNAAMIDLPRGDIIAALDTDHYRFHWVTGSYLLGGAAGMCLTRFCAGRWGLRVSFCGALLLFTAAAALCGTVSEVVRMAPLRLLQGAGAGLTVSAGMVLLWRAFGEEKPRAMALYGLAVYLAALAGPVVAGLLTAALSWRWVFYLDLPLGLAAAARAVRLLEAERPAPAGPVPFDFVGLVLFLAAVAALNVVLDMGQYWGWATSPFFVPWLAALVICGGAFVLWGALARAPLIDLRLFAVRNYALGIAIKAVFSINLYVLLGLLSAYMIGLRRYQWWQGALVFLPAAAVFAVLAAGSVRWQSYRRGRMFAGMALMALATWSISAVDLYTDKRWLAAGVALWAAGAGLVLVPVMRTIFEGLTPAQTLHAAGVFNMTRLLPAYAAGALLAALLVQRADAHFDRLREDVTYNRPIVSETTRHLLRHYADRGSGLERSRQQARATLGRWVHANARAFALQTILRYLALVPVVGMGMVVFVRRPARAENAATPAA